MSWPTNVTCIILSYSLPLKPSTIATHTTILSKYIYISVINSTELDRYKTNGHFTDADSADSRNGLSNRFAFKIRTETTTSSETAISADVYIDSGTGNCSKILICAYVGRVAQSV